MRHVGPGAITGAADDDPSGIATYTQAGAQFGTGLDFTPIDPMKALYWSAVINGMVAVPIMVGLMLLASKREVMGAFTSGPKTRWFGWGGVGVMGFAVLMMLWDVARQVF